MFSELFKRCLLGDRIAATQLFLQIVLHQRLEDLFKRMGLEPKLIILPFPQPGPPSFELGKAMSESNLLKVLQVIPKEDATFFSPEIQLEALQKIKIEFQQLINEVDDEIKIRTKDKNQTS